MVGERNNPWPRPHVTTDMISWPGTQTRASLMAQRAKSALAMQETQETWVGSLGQEDPLEEEILA